MEKLILLKPLAQQAPILFTFNQQTAWVAILQLKKL